MAKDIVPKIQLSKDEEDRLKERLDDMIKEAESFRKSSEWSELHKEYWRAHLAEP